MEGIFVVVKNPETIVHSLEMHSIVEKSCKMPYDSPCYERTCGDN